MARKFQIMRERPVLMTVQVQTPSSPRGQTTVSIEVLSLHIKETSLLINKFSVLAEDKNQGLSNGKKQRRHFGMKKCALFF